MKNPCKHPGDKVFKIGPAISWYSDWQWCGECGATRLILNNKFGEKMKEKRPNLFYWKSPSKARES